MLKKHERRGVSGFKASKAPLGCGQRQRYIMSELEFDGSFFGHGYFGRGEDRPMVEKEKRRATVPMPSAGFFKAEHFVLTAEGEPEFLCNNRVSLQHPFHS